MPSPDIVAAGAVVVRRGDEVLLVHRPKYDDWSLPKGKLDPGEHVTVAAVREVEEETGLRVRLGPPLTPQRYRVAAGAKRVHYWVARVVGSDDISSYPVNDEIDALAWLPWRKAERRLTQDHDRATLAEARGLRRRTRALVVLRHAEAVPRKAWEGDDRRRPLTGEGHAQSAGLVPVLGAYGVSLVVSSSSTRCLQTVDPYVAASRWPVVPRDELSEEDASRAGVAAVVDELLHAGECSVLCTHRPVLPLVLDALGLPPTKLEKPGMVVVHHRRGGVVATEVHGGR